MERIRHIQNHLELILKLHHLDLYSLHTLPKFLKTFSNLLSQNTKEKQLKKEVILTQHLKVWFIMVGKAWQWECGQLTTVHHD